MRFSKVEFPSPAVSGRESRWDHLGHAFLVVRILVMLSPTGIPWGRQGSLLSERQRGEAGYAE